MVKYTMKYAAYVYLGRTRYYHDGDPAGLSYAWIANPIYRDVYTWEQYKLIYHRWNHLGVHYEEVMTSVDITEREDV